jgi:hypothetical protein
VTFQYEDIAATARTAHLADPLPAFRDEVIDRTEKHIIRHSHRGARRGIEAPEIETAEIGMLAAVEALGEAGSEADRVSASNGAHEALSDWKLALEDLSDGPESLSLHQCAEVDQGEIGTLLSCLDSLDYLATDECKARFTPTQILLDLASVLLSCPQYPAEDM